MAEDSGPWPPPARTPAAQLRRPLDSAISARWLDLVESPSDLVVGSPAHQQARYEVLASKARAALAQLNAWSEGRAGLAESVCTANQELSKAVQELLRWQLDEDAA